MTPIRATERAAWAPPVGAALATTAVVTALSYGMPAEHAASAVGFGFLGATYWLALRDGDPEPAEHYGLSLGGLLDRSPLELRRLVRSAAVATGWALAIGAIVFPPFWAGYFLWWSPRVPFHASPLAGVASEILGQLLVIALPEEAFYRGYLQTRLDDVWAPRWRVLGATLGPGVIVASTLFALGHVATELHPSRLAVFFPSLLFGWLRARRGGIGAAVVLHALCNLFASYLAQSYGFGV